MSERVHQFPLGICIATLATTGVGLWAALASVQWGAGQPRADALAFGLNYVNLALGAIWFLVWPAAIYRQGVSNDIIPSRLRLQILTILISAIPAMGIAAWLSMATTNELAQSIGLQLSFAFFSFGLLAFGRRSTCWQISIASVLAFLYLAMPAVAYLQLEFLPAISSHWMRVIPALALTGYNGSNEWIWGIAAIYAAIGLLLTVLARRSV